MQKHFTRKGKPVPMWSAEWGRDVNTSEFHREEIGSCSPAYAVVAEQTRACVHVLSVFCGDLWLLRQLLCNTQPDYELRPSAFVSKYPRSKCIHHRAQLIMSVYTRRLTKWITLKVRDVGKWCLHSGKEHLQKSERLGDSPGALMLNCIRLLSSVCSTKNWKANWGASGLRGEASWGPSSQSQEQGKKVCF